MHMFFPPHRADLYCPQQWRLWLNLGPLLPTQGWLGLNVGGLDFLQIAGLAAGQDSDGTKLFDVGRNINQSSFKRSEKSSGKVFQLAYIFLIIKRSVWEEQSLFKNIKRLTVKWKILMCNYYRQHQHKNSMT